MNRATYSFLRRRVSGQRCSLQAIPWNDSGTVLSLERHLPSGCLGYRLSYAGMLESRNTCQHGRFQPGISPQSPKWKLVRKAGSLEARRQDAAFAQRVDIRDAVAIEVAG